MPKFRFETIAFGRTTTFEEELASADLASPRAIEKAALTAGRSTGVDQSGSITKVYDEAGYLVATVNFSDVLHSEPSSVGSTTEEPGVMRSG